MIADLCKLIPRRLPIFASFLVVVVLAACAQATPAFADHCVLFGCQDATYGSYDQYNRALLELRKTGVSRWTYIQEPSGAFIKPAIQAAKKECADEFEFRVEEVADGWRQIASGGMAFVYGNSLHGPGGTGAIGIVDNFLTPSQQIVYDSAAMATWGQDSQVEVVNHEDCGHQLGNLDEGYIHTGGVIRCAPLDTPQHRSFMNCGLANGQHVDDFIRAAWRESHYPAPFTPTCGLLRNLPCVGTGRNAAGFYVWFCEPVKDVKVTRVAVLREDGSWTGIYLDPADLDANRCRGAIVPEGRYMLKRESELSWRRNHNAVRLF